MSNAERDHMALNNIKTRNAFELFSTPIGYAVDVNYVNAQYKSLLQKFHPDRYPANSGEHVLACDLTEYINMCYTQIKDPLQRVQILLKSCDAEIPGADGQSVNDVDIMMEALDLKELQDTIVDQKSYDQVMLELASLENEIGGLIAEFYQDKNIKKLQRLYMRLSFVIKTKRDAVSQHMGIHYAAAN